MDIDSSQLDKRLALARGIAVEAGDLTLTYFRSDRYVVERKDDDSPVTRADREAEQLMRRRIEREFPDDAIMGEEFEPRVGTSGFRWILDPIDGTKSFICGVPLYGTLVAVEYDSSSVIGVIHIPALSETVYAGDGRGAWYGRGKRPAKAAHVSSCDTLANGLFVTSQVDSFAQRDAGPVFHDLQRRASITRTWGDCYGYLLIATGRAEVMVDPIMNLWDAAALAPILREAGGRFTDWAGSDSIYHGEGIGSNGRLHDEVLQVTQPYTQRR